MKSHTLLITEGNTWEFLDRTWSSLTNKWGISRGCPELYVFYDIEDSKEIWRGIDVGETPLGWVNDGALYVASYDMHEEKFGGGIEAYNMMIKHELLHLIYFELSKDSHGPNWLWEGFAQYFSGDVVYEYNKQLEFLDHYEDWADIVYTQGGYLVKRLYEGFGHEKFKELLKRVGEMDSTESTERVFTKFYKKPMRELFVELLEEPI